MKSAYQNLGEFISELEKAGELLRIKAPVSRELEITHITDLASKAPGGGKALLFEHVRESLFPVLTNAFGSERRICMALGTDSLDKLAQRIERFVRMEPPKSLRQIGEPGSNGDRPHQVSAPKDLGRPPARRSYTGEKRSTFPCCRS